MNAAQDDSGADFAAYQLEQRRLYEEEQARFTAAHPGYELCQKHPDRPVVDSSVCTRRFCAECIEDRAHGYADHYRDRGTWRDWANRPEFDMAGYHDRGLFPKDDDK